MQTLITQPLDSVSFEAFGKVFPTPGNAGEANAIDNLENLRFDALPYLATTCAEPIRSPIEIGAMERHPFSSQGFIPISLSRYLIVVAPPTRSKFPDLGKARGFVGQMNQAFNYHAGTWHSGFSLLDAIGQYAMIIWRNGKADDVEIHRLSPPITVSVR